MLSLPVGRVLSSMSVPIALAMVSTFFFQLVDTYFVGQLGPDSLTALGFAGAVYVLMVALIMGIAVGVSALVGSALGRGDPVAARRYATLAIVVALLLSVMLAGLGWGAVEPLFGLLGADGRVMPLIVSYMGPIYGGWPLLVFALIGIGAIQARGQVVLPAVTMGVAGMLNAGLDWALIYGRGPFPALGFRGAALATVASWAFAASCIALVLHRYRLLTVPRRRIRETVVEILGASIPPVGAQLLIPVTGVLLTYLAARVGPEVVAAIGVVARVETLGMVGVSALVNALVPFVAQNVGASLQGRARQALRFANLVSLAWGGGLAVLLILLGGRVTQIFTTDPAIEWSARLYFYVVAPSYGALGMLTVASAFLNGAQQPRGALRLLMVKTLFLTAPLAIIGAQFGATGLFVAISVGNLGGAFLALRGTKPWRRQTGRERSSGPILVRDPSFAGGEE